MLPHVHMFDPKLVNDKEDIPAKLASARHVCKPGMSVTADCRHVHGYRKLFQNAILVILCTFR